MITLSEYAKRISNPIQSGLIQTFAENSGLLSIMPFKDILGNASTTRTDDTSNVTGVASRAINTEYVESTGESTSDTRSLIMIGGKCSVDRYQIKTSFGTGGDLLAEEIESKVKAICRMFERMFISGATATTATEFNGLKASIASGQVISQGTTVGGDSLTLLKLDEAIDLIQGTPSAILCNKRVARIINQLAREANQTTEPINGSFGQMFWSYAGIPILPMTKDEVWSEILPFDEPDCATIPAAALTSSIYCVKFDSNGVYGIQNSPPIVDVQGYVGNSLTAIVDWFVNLKIASTLSISRLKGITSSLVVS